MIYYEWFYFGASVAIPEVNARLCATATGNVQKHPFRVAERWHGITFLCVCSSVVYCVIADCWAQVWGACNTFAIVYGWPNLMAVDED